MRIPASDRLILNRLRSSTPAESNGLVNSRAEMRAEKPIEIQAIIIRRPNHPKRILAPISFDRPKSKQFGCLDTPKLKSLKPLK